jgi:hypothetical protein
MALIFLTGSLLVPVGGFEELNPLYTIAKVGISDDGNIRLPAYANQIDLQAYSSIDKSRRN